MRKGLLISLAIASSVFAGVAFAERAVTTTGTADKQKSEWESKQKEKVQAQVKEKVQTKSLTQTVATTEKARQENWLSKKNEIREKAEKTKEAFKLKKEKLNADKCARVQERIQNKEGNLEQAKEKHMSVYTNLVNRVQKFIDRYKLAGLDTAKIEADLIALNGKIAEFKTAYATYSAKASESKLSACSETEGDFRGKLVDARTELKITHEIAADIRTFVRTVILVDLRVLQAQMPQEEATVETEEVKTETEKTKIKSKVKAGDETETETETEAVAPVVETTSVN